MNRKTAAHATTAALALLLAASIASALAKEEIYYGSSRRFSRPAEINARRVFMAIPAYKEIIEKNIDKTSALYLVKLAEANEVFRETIRRFAEANNYDLICEEGKMEGAYNATEDVIKAIKGDEKA